MSISANDLANLYVNALAEIGLTSKIDDDKDVTFQTPDLGRFYISLQAESDPEFMRMIFPNFMDQRLTGGDISKLLKLINDVNRSNTAVKLYVGFDKDGDANVSAVIECFVAGPDEPPSSAHLNAIMKRCLSAMGAGIQKLLKTAKEEDSV